MTRTDVVRELTERLGSASEARWLAEEVVGTDRSPLDAAARRRLEGLVARRLAGEPLQYVLGTWSFRTLELAVDRRALIPRPETEQVVEVALGELTAVSPPEGHATVVDLGTGSGAIALSLAVEEGARRPGLRVVATDRSPSALALAAENLERLRRADPAAAGRVRLVEGDWLAALDPSLAGSVTLVVSNPPYVAEHEWDELQPEVRHEPRPALLAGPGSDGTPGMADIERILDGARRWLAHPGSVVVELAPAQAAPAAALARDLGYEGVRVHADLAGRSRVLVGRTR